MPRCTWSVEERLRVIAAANKISLPHGLVSDLLGGGEIMSTGVQGDARTYTPVIVLIGWFPGWEVLSKVSNQITNTLPVNRVTWMAACKDENGEPLFFMDRNKSST